MDGILRKTEITSGLKKWHEITDEDEDVFSPTDYKKEAFSACIRQWEAAGKPDFFTFKIGDEPFALVKTDEGFSLVVGVCPEDK